ncbi:phage holin family protein [Bacillus sp. FJAT-22090]|uniref:phage holin family protein n=1 Tax=Bacillus sp. FJAT-22090 TaxID=1581038 RepID=UPI000B1C0203|nr:phage holin family protein [Bacillus sp. FJAT-22090]
MFIEKLLFGFTFFGTIFAFLIGGWHISLTILVAFMVIDIVTGLIKAAIQKKLNSKVSYRGFLKKTSIMLVIIIANLLDLLTASGVPVFRTMAVFFYIGMEGLSIVENLGHIGIPLPKGIIKYIEQLSKEEIPTNREE